MTSPELVDGLPQALTVTEVTALHGALKFVTEDLGPREAGRPDTALCPFTKPSVDRGRTWLYLDRRTEPGDLADLASQVRRVGEQFAPVAAGDGLAALLIVYPHLRDDGDLGAQLVGMARAAAPQLVDLGLMLGLAVPEPHETPPTLRHPSGRHPNSPVAFMALRAMGTHDVRFLVFADTPPARREAFLAQRGALFERGAVTDPSLVEAYQLLVDIVAGRAEPLPPDVH